MQSATEHVDMCRPAVYAVRVQGALGDTWTAAYTTMTIKVDHVEDNQATTTLVGTLKDQAQLVGLLMRLFDLGYPILFVEHLPAMAVRG
jgi:hypothetical protein